MIFADDVLYKDITPRLFQRETDLTAVTVVTPREGVWKKAGEELAGLIYEKWNNHVVLEYSDGSRIKNNWSGNRVLIGNLANNPYIAGLYSLYMAYTDAVHPGKGGYQLQTVTDPFGIGGNTVLLGVSDEEGLCKGIERLLQIIKSLTKPVLPWCSESVLSDEVQSILPFGKSPSEHQIQKIIKTFDIMVNDLDPSDTRELSSVKLQSLLMKVMEYGRLYQLTNDIGYGLCYRHAWISYANHVCRYSKSALTRLSVRNMWTYGYPLIASYNVMEASPLFSVEDRNLILSAIYLTYEANSLDGYLTRAPAVGARFNHDIFPALSILFGSDYLIKYHDIRVAREWYESGDRIFKGNTTNISLDEGSDYIMHVPEITLQYAFVTGDYRFLAKGLRPSADLFAMMIDNLGTMSGGGDVYPFGYSSAYSWNHSQVMNTATWFFGEPLYKFLLERTKEGPFPGQGMKDLDFPFHRYLHDATVTPVLEGQYPMVQAYPVEKGVYDDIPDHPLDVALEDTVHKIAFREGFRLEDSYLMLDGFSAGRHGHMDGNTIIKYSAKGRIFIDDRDYIEKAPKNHTGVLVIKDGVQEPKPPLAGVEWVVDADGIGISKTVVPNYNKADWIRTIVAIEGRFFVILDDMITKEDGKYIFENTWQTLGSLRTEEDRFDVTQEGVMMSIQSLDESSLRSYERYGHFKKYWKSEYLYPYADEEHVLRQVKEEREYRKGERSTFINVLSSSCSEAPSVKAGRFNDHTLWTEENNKKVYISCKPVLTTDFESDGNLHIVYDEGMVIAGAKKMRIGAMEKTFMEPVVLKIDGSKCSWTAYKRNQALTCYDDNGNPIRDGIIDSGYFEKGMDPVGECRLILGESSDSKPLKKSPGRKNIRNNSWISRGAFIEKATASCSVDINDDGDPEMIIGGVTGKVQALDSSGRILWAFQSIGRVNEITAYRVKNETIIFVATENWVVHKLDGRGNETLCLHIPNDPPRRERKGNLLGVTCVRLAYVDGTDKDPWIMVGTRFRYLYGFDLKGKKLYEDIAYFYGIEDMTFLDLDGDGKDEGVLMLEYYHLCIWKNREMKHYGGAKTGGPGFKVVKGLDGRNGVDPAVAVYGTKQNTVHMFRFDKEPLHLWKVNVGGEVNDLIAGDFDKDGSVEILAASDGFMVYCINLDGSVRWKTTLPDRVMKITAMNTKEGTVYLAVVDHGGLVSLDSQGNVIRTEYLEDLILNAPIVTKEEKTLALLQNGRIYENS